jgi:hypothetical protein
VDEVHEEDADTNADTTASDESADDDARRLDAALAALDDGTLRVAVNALSEQSRTDLADTLQLPRATMHLGNALAPLLRRKLRASPPARQLSAAFALAEGVNDETVHALGDRHDDPSRDDMLAVLPAVIEQHGTSLVTLLLAAYAVSDAQCQAVMADLLATDERFAIGEAVHVEARDAANSADTRARTTAAGANADAGAEARRDERKAAKAARREAQQHQRAAQQAAHAARTAAQRRAKRT